MDRLVLGTAAGGNGIVLHNGTQRRQSGGLDIGGATRHALLQPRTSIIRL